MKRYPKTGAALSGLAAGLVNGIFGGAGGMVLLPLLEGLTDAPSEALFSLSVSVMLPVCALALALAGMQAPLPWADALPYLTGSLFGGIAAGLLGKKIPAKWLHRAFGLLLLWGGIRYLW